MGKKKIKISGAERKKLNEAIKEYEKDIKDLSNMEIEATEIPKIDFNIIKHKDVELIYLASEEIRDFITNIKEPINSVNKINNAVVKILEIIKPMYEEVNKYDAGE